MSLDYKGATIRMKLERLPHCGHFHCTHDTHDAPHPGVSGSPQIRAVAGPCHCMEGPPQLKQRVMKQHGAAFGHAARRQRTARGAG